MMIIQMQTIRNMENHMAFRVTLMLSVNVLGDYSNRFTMTSVLPSARLVSKPKR